MWDYSHLLCVFVCPRACLCVLVCVISCVCCVHSLKKLGTVALQKICFHVFLCVRYNGRHAAERIVGKLDKQSFSSLFAFQVFLSLWMVVGGHSGCSV